MGRSFICMVYVVFCTIVPYISWLICWSGGLGIPGTVGIQCSTIYCRLAWLGFKYVAWVVLLYYCCITMFDRLCSTDCVHNEKMALFMFPLGFKYAPYQWGFVRWNWVVGWTGDW